MSLVRFVIALLAVALAVAPHTPARAQSEEGRAVLLVADPGLGSDPVYARTVLLVAAGPNGHHIGLIINRPTEHSLASLFPAHEPSRGVKEHVYFGGPMSSDMLVALVRGESSPGQDALTLARGLYLAVAAQTVDSVIETTPQDARFYAGLVVWRPGELQEELKRGLWLVREADVRQVFRADPEQMWNELQRRPAGLSVRAD